MGNSKSANLSRVMNHPAERAAARLRKGMSHRDYKHIIDKEYEHAPIMTGRAATCSRGAKIGSNYTLEDAKADNFNNAFEQWWESQGLDGEQVRAQDIDRWTLARSAFIAGRTAKTNIQISDTAERLIELIKGWPEGVVESELETQVQDILAA